MSELKRVLFSRKLWILIGICIFLNLCLFVREQQASNYGFDVLQNEPIEEVRAEYDHLLEEYKNIDLGTALNDVSEIAELSSRYEYIQQMISMRDTLLASDEGRQHWELIYGTDYELYKVKYPDLFQTIENTGSVPDREDINIRSVAAYKLLSQIQYLNGYESYLSNVQKNADRLKSFSIFQNEGGFSNTNIEQTARDFLKIQGISVKLDNYDNIHAFFTFRITDYLLLICIFMITIIFAEGRKEGIWQMIHASSEGRIRLSVCRIISLLLGITMLVSILYGSTFFASSIIYKQIGNLLNPMQSVELFGKLPLPASMLGLLLIYFLLRVFTAFIIGLLFWLLLVAFHNHMKLSVSVIILFFGVEFYLYYSLPDRSIYNFWKFLNVFLYIDSKTLLSRYLNINLFGMAVHICLVALICGTLLGLIIGLLCIRLDTRYPHGTAVCFSSLDAFVRRLYFPSGWINLSA